MLTSPGFFFKEANLSMYVMGFICVDSWNCQFDPKRGGKVDIGVNFSAPSILVRTLDLKTLGCGFDSQAGQPNKF